MIAVTVQLHIKENPFQQDARKKGIQQWILWEKDKKNR